jgi:hypothetical protein
MSGQYPYYAASSSNPYASTSYSGNPYSTNPYANPNAGQAPVVPANAYEYDVGMLAQSSVYVPGAAIDKRGGAGGKVEKGGKRVTGRVWEDQTLLEWDPSECSCSTIEPGGLLDLQSGSASSLAMSATMSQMMFWQRPSASIHPLQKLESSEISSVKRPNSASLRFPIQKTF